MLDLLVLVLLELILFELFVLQFLVLDLFDFLDLQLLVEVLAFHNFDLFLEPFGLLGHDVSPVCQKTGRAAL